MMKAPWHGGVAGVAEDSSAAGEEVSELFQYQTALLLRDDNFQISLSPVHSDHVHIPQNSVNYFV